MKHHLLVPAAICLVACVAGPSDTHLEVDSIRAALRSEVTISSLVGGSVFRDNTGSSFRYISWPSREVGRVPTDPDNKVYRAFFSLPASDLQRIPVGAKILSVDLTLNRNNSQRNVEVHAYPVPQGAVSNTDAKAEENFRAFGSGTRYGRVGFAGSAGEATGGLSGSVKADLERARDDGAAFNLGLRVYDEARDYADLAMATLRIEYETSSASGPDAGTGPSPPPVKGAEETCESSQVRRRKAVGSFSMPGHRSGSVQLRFRVDGVADGTFGGGRFTYSALNVGGRVIALNTVTGAQREIFRGWVHKDKSRPPIAAFWSPEIEHSVADQLQPNEELRGRIEVEALVKSKKGGMQRCRLSHFLGTIPCDAKTCGPNDCGTMSDGCGGYVHCGACAPPPPPSCPPGTCPVGEQCCDCNAPGVCLQ